MGLLPSTARIQEISDGYSLRRWRFAMDKLDFAYLVKRSVQTSVGQLLINHSAHVDQSIGHGINGRRKSQQARNVLQIWSVFCNGFNRGSSSFFSLFKTKKRQVYKNTHLSAWKSYWPCPLSYLEKEYLRSACLEDADSQALQSGLQREPANRDR